MPPPIKLKEGTRFWRLKILKSFIDSKRRQTKCYCLCDCGNITDVWQTSLRSGHTKSCGCKERNYLPVRLGTRFGRLKVLKNFVDPSRHETKCHCLCDCGNMRIIRRSSLFSGATKSCGCLKREMIGRRRRTHGMYNHPLYFTWRNMIDRCTKPSRKDWKDYGGRGIEVCKRWLKSFPNFVKDMGPKPSPELTLERFLNYEGYKPSNCAWATRGEQNRNRRNMPLVQRNDKA